MATFLSPLLDGAVVPLRDGYFLSAAGRCRRSYALAVGGWVGGCVGKWVSGYGAGWFLFVGPLPLTTAWVPP